MVCAHYSEPRDKASAGLQHCYLLLLSLTKKRASEKILHSAELINKIGMECKFKLLKLKHLCKYGYIK